jgi:hypothetical protein
MIQGYPDDASAFPGQDLVFHVSTDAPQFRIDFYRQGATLDFKHSTLWMKGVFADNHEPDQDWGEAATRRDGKQVAAWLPYPFTVPDDWQTGVYIAMFVEGDGQDKPNANQNPPLNTKSPDAATGKALFAVKNPVPGVASQVLYKVPLFTYQMYNATLYKGLDDQLHGGSGYQGYWVTLHRPGGGTGGTPWDVMKMFFDTPNLDKFDMDSNRQTFAHWDAKFGAWLEGVGFRVDYCTDMDIHLDNDGSLLSPYSLVLSVGHDEYYTTEMRDHLETYVANGGNIAFFSGNTCYWRLIFPQPGSANITRDANWATKPTQDDPSQPGRPEDSLTGVGFRNGGERNYPVPQDDSQMVGYTVQHTELWPFEGVKLNSGETFGKDECIVGYECDGTKYDRNAPHPLAPSFDPDDHTPTGFVILGTGDTSSWGQQGNSAATMGMYTDSGTAFAGATTDWSRVVGLGEAHAVQITRNVMNRLGGNPKGVAGLSNLAQVIACDGFFSGDDSYRHAIVGTGDGGITEIFFNPQTGLGQTVLVQQQGLLDVGSFYSDDDQYRHVITVRDDGNIWEVFYSPKTGLGQALLDNVPNAVRVAGFFSGDDNRRHAIVATRTGDVFEIYFHPKLGQGKTSLGSFNNIVDIGAFYSPDDQFRHVIVGTADGTVTEIYFNPGFGVQQAVIASVPGLLRVSSYYAGDDSFFNRRVQVAAAGGRIHEIRYHPDFGVMRVVLYNTGGLLDLGGFFSPDDNYRHAILATPAGDIQELFFQP